MATGSGDRFRAIDSGQTIWLGSTMNNANEQWVRITSRILLLLLIISGAPDLARAFTPQESVPNHEQQQMPDTAPAPAKQQNELPDSPGVMRAPADASQQSEPQRPSQSFVQGDQKPLGTAAAEGCQRPGNRGLKAGRNGYRSRQATPDAVFPDQDWRHSGGWSCGRHCDGTHYGKPEQTSWRQVNKKWTS